MVLEFLDLNKHRVVTRRPTLVEHQGKDCWETDREKTNERRAIFSPKLYASAIAERVTILCYYRDINDSSDKELARTSATGQGGK